MKDETLVNHPPRVILREDNIPLVTPIYQSVKFATSGDNYHPEDGEVFFYSRVSNPTVRELEKLLAQFQRCEDGIALASGNAAVSTAILSQVKSGDNVITFVESYKPSRRLIGEVLGRFGVTSALAQVDRWKDLPKLFKNSGRNFLLFESPTNPMTRVPDLEGILDLTKKHGVFTILDNTFAGFQNHQGLPIDLFVHSLTKFAAGHGDVMGGIILGKKALLENIRHEAAQLGPVLDPHAAFLILRGMKTYSVRYQRHCENAMKVAQWLSKHPKIERVLYPGLPSHPDHAMAKKQLKDFGAIVALVLKSEKDVVTRFLRNLKLIPTAGSLGSTESLAAPVRQFYSGDLKADEEKVAGLSLNSIRLSIGLEDPQDIIQDLEAALNSI